MKTFYQTRSRSIQGQNLGIPVCLISSQKVYPPKIDIGDFCFDPLHHVYFSYISMFMAYWKWEIGFDYFLVASFAKLQAMMDHSILKSATFYSDYLLCGVQTLLPAGDRAHKMPHDSGGNLIRGCMVRVLTTTLAVAACVASAILCSSGSCLAQEEGQDSGKPLFEIGIGGGVGYIPDYPAADQNHVQAAALPYVIYRGDVFRADRNGIQGRLYRSDHIALEVSLEGALGSSADDNRARQGMPDIDLLGEVGPALKINLHRDIDRHERIDLTLPVRSVFSTDFTRIKYRGLVFAPDIAYTRAGLIAGGDQLRLSLGPIFASSHLMDYFYQVDPQYANAGRPAYDGRAGYLGLRLHSSLVMPVTERISAFGAVRGELFSGATNDGSPLYKRNINLSIGAGLTLSLYRSDSRVSAVNDILD